ncbi:MAG: alpha/beta fold hydrolase, partial [Alphaproteobacteria bacterium]|nr:alpha/beta fold hydrolase [Alphaproteobacteria bacterium]
AGLPQAQENELLTSDGLRIIAWFVPPADNSKAVILYFHGNASNLANRAARLRLLTRDGTGLLAVSYRGYGGSQGSPNEKGLIEDARAAHDYLVKQGIAEKRIVLMGESLGSGVAIALAQTHHAGAIILEAPFSSAADVAASVYWMFPVRWLMKDPFDSAARITRSNAPVLILHGDRDPVVPFRFGEKLFHSARESKRLVRIPGGGHQILETPQALAEIRQWIAQHTAADQR